MKTKLDWTLRNGWLLLEPLEAGKTDGGLYLADVGDDSGMIGHCKVVEASDGYWMDGTFVATKMKRGDVVIMHPGGQRIVRRHEKTGKMFHFGLEGDVVAVVKELAEESDAVVSAN